jgi:hypothetical protein
VGLRAFHYGRWAYSTAAGDGPGAVVARPFGGPRWSRWTGAPDGVVRDGRRPVYGWVPLAWGEPYRPWWGALERLLGSLQPARTR